MGRDYWDIQPAGDGWEVKKEGGEEASKTFDRKSDAVDYGTDIARRNDGGVRIKRKDGTIQDERAYGDDPHPPEG